MLGTSAVAAAGLTEALVTVLYAVVIGFGMGVTANGVAAHRRAQSRGRSRRCRTGDLVRGKENTSCASAAVIAERRATRRLGSQATSVMPAQPAVEFQNVTDYDASHARYT